MGMVADRKRWSAAILGAVMLAALMVAVPVSTARAVSDSLVAGAPAGQERDQRGDIVINTNAEFDADHGVRSGKGTHDDPYVISGWIVPNLVIRNTDRHVVITNTVVDGTMVLDWIGMVHVHRNTVSDLRVNQNVERWGPMTDGVIAHNRFAVVGQLRHWDGDFEHNVVGTPDELVRWPNFRAVNFDGFNGASFRNNEIYGYVDVKLHGHHHSSNYGSASHDHYGTGSAEEADPHAQHGGGYVDHGKRYHEVFVTNNTIHSTYDWALRYTDTNHTGDDRTAASETNKLLNCPHVHFTRVHLTNNKLIGGALMVDVFNAYDENHWGTEHGLVEIKGNQIGLERDSNQLLGGRHGIVVADAVDLDLRIVDNTIDGPNQLQDDNDLLDLERKLNTGAGIFIARIDQANVYILNNTVAYRQFGIQAIEFTNTVKWWVKGLQTIQVDEDVHRDGSVPKPRD